MAAVSEALVPSTFAEMAHFNASVMGLGNPPWLSEIVPLPTLRGEIGAVQPKRGRDRGRTTESVTQSQPR